MTFSQPNEQNRLPVWSPDGNRIVFSSGRGGHSQIYEKSVSGVGAENVVSRAKDIATRPRGLRMANSSLVFRRTRNTAAYNSCAIQTCGR